jgi:hypothetical protein
MCLLAGDMKEAEPWAAVMPWVRSLTRRRIGQLWLHHTGHDESRSYGDKTKEWQRDTVMHMEAIERADADVSFALEFRKARERTPATRLRSPSSAMNGRLMSPRRFDPAMYRQSAKNFSTHSTTH